MMKSNPFDTEKILELEKERLLYHSLKELEKHTGSVDHLPISIRILLEGAIRLCDGFRVTEGDVANIAGWKPRPKDVEIPFMPARVLMQDLTGGPAIIDLASMRSAISKLGGNPERINPIVRADLVIDHSLQVDAFGYPEALKINTKREFERNLERYRLFKWAQKAFDNLHIVPPESGICHQVNLEYLATVVAEQKTNGQSVLYPDTCIGMDSHTPMVNALGVLGWGVGGIEAEAVMLGQLMRIQMPEVIGFRLKGKLREGTTATDLVLAITSILRKKGVVNKFVEFFGGGLDTLSVPDRATIANMAPECGSTVNFFPVDEQVIRYLLLTGRKERHVRLIELYLRAQNMFRTPDMKEAHYTDIIELDLSTIEPTIAGPMRPQDSVPLSGVKSAFSNILKSSENNGFGLDEREMEKEVPLQPDGKQESLRHGSVVIAAITSCTNTSNPAVMIGAGLLAKKAVERGLKVPGYVKTSMAPGSKVVTEYLSKAGLDRHLEKLGFYTVGYGCTTCIGNSGPLPENVSNAIEEGSLVVSSVLSGNRNFSGRIHQQTEMNWLMSPLLVVAYALAGNIGKDLISEPLGTGNGGKEVYLHDIWPSQKEIEETISAHISRDMFVEKYRNIMEGPEEWKSIDVNESLLFDFDPASTYLREPDYFEGMGPHPETIKPIKSARCLAVFGDSVTTDHISPAGAIERNGPAARYLLEKGVKEEDFNTYGSRRGNHEVMVRGTFSNVRIRNLLLKGKEGGYTVHFRSGKTESIFDAAMRYKSESVPLIIVAGNEYGSGSSRDWAAKGPALLGVKAILAESFERIHRSNLIGMGILPLEFRKGENMMALGLTGTETFDIEIDDNIKPKQEIKITVHMENGSIKEFAMVSRIDMQLELEYFRHGGILKYVLRQMMGA
ncbi:MAG: aconitate hydratase AcnA [Candidatus Aenigmarchaeota archaeon]|nr:aconitate hydratase AcnA [Candidatus Aenigmarchaeota archaeon]